ncbi:fungal specific transcription factor [Ophiostoma piceae UAMH 11346]|uniref:Fungal specific transcription factor n=1 Tax=Ophiostoma piceae (strain UAMH 11346) TaxID=1262450 RepID=S3BTR7_OPHP1|nr:fungal specific transcription factor [Ophiostoma piceae UAMH 11346]
MDVTGLLVKHFLYGGNFYHYILYDKQFTGIYTAWWQDRKNGRPVSAAFTCLVLRACACSAQYLPADKRSDIENAYGQSSKELAQRFHNHAQRLGATVPPGTGGLVQVQQMMLGVHWLQFESQWTASWHALAATIHEAQEQARLPMLQLYSPATNGSVQDDNNALAASTHMLLQYQLVTRITRRFGNISLPLPVETALNVVSEVRDWLEAFPAAYTIPCRDPDMDRKHKWLASQRAHLHTLAYIVILILLKPFIVKASSGAKPRVALGTASILDRSPNTSPAAEDSAQQQGIDAAIALIKVNGSLYERLYPDSLQPNLIFFAVFSTSAVMCPAVMTDMDCTLPRRAEVVECIGQALDILYRMSSERPVIKTGFKALHKLSVQMQLAAPETSILRRKHYAPGQRQLRQRHGGGVTGNMASLPSPLELKLSAPLLPSMSLPLPGTKRSVLRVPDIGQLSPLAYYPGPAALLTPSSPYTPRVADTAQGGEYATQSSHAYAAAYPYSRLDAQLFPQMSLAGPRYDDAVYGSEDGQGHGNRSGSRNGGGSSAGGRMGAMVGLGIYEYDSPPPLSQTTPMTELHGLDAGFGGADSLDLGAAVAWPPLDMDAGQQYMAQGMGLHWRR